MSLLTASYKDINFSGLQTDTNKPILHKYFTEIYCSSLAVILIINDIGNTEVLIINPSKITTW